MNKKGQTGLFVLFGLIVFGMIWLTGLAPMVSNVGTTFVLTNELTGINAFFYTNLNLVIGLFYFIALVVAGRSII